jgi:hypothetical protein
MQEYGETWNMAFVEEDKDLHTGTYIQYRFIGPSSSTDSGDYDVVDAIPACYTVEYRISKPGTAKSAVITNQSIQTNLVEYEGKLLPCKHMTICRCHRGRAPIAPGLDKEFMP